MTRSSIAARNFSKRLISTFFAATLALGLVPAAAFAVDEPTGAESPQNVISSEGNEASNPLVISSGEAEGLGDEKSALPMQNGEAVTDSSGEDTAMDDIADADASISIPAATQRVNEDVTLSTRTVAQAESTRSYFLAQTLESTRTVPIVSANLPLDTGAVNEVIEPVEDNGTAEDEGGEDSDEADLAPQPIAAESTVVGSFEYRGLTYAVEPGGESVAVAAADYSKLPEEFIEAQTIVLPSMVTADGLNYYSVTRIADNAFAGLTSEVALQYAVLTEPVEEASAEEGSDVEGAEDDSIGITAITIPASVTEIGDDAFANFDTLQYVIVSEDNPNYGMYDGCLYDADLTSLLLIPEGRLGAVWVAPSVTTIDPEVFSHCALVDTVIADPDSAAFQLLSENGEKYKNKHNATVFLHIADGSETAEVKMPSYDNLLSLEVEQASADSLESCDVSAGDESSFSYRIQNGANATVASAAAPVYINVPSGYRLWHGGRDNTKIPLPVDAATGKVYGKATHGDYTDVTWAQYDIEQASVVVNGRTWIRHKCVADFITYISINRDTYGVVGKKTWDHWWTFLTDTSGNFVEASSFRVGSPSGRSLVDSERVVPNGEYYFLPVGNLTWNAQAYGGSVADLDGEYRDSVETAAYLDEGLPHIPSVRAPEGLKFKGWTTDSTGKAGYILPNNGETAYSTPGDGFTYVDYPEDQTVEITDDTTFYAVWTIDVNWDASTYGGRLSNGDSSVTTPVTVNTAADLPAVADMGDGWKFEGWIPKGSTPNGTYYDASNKPTITAEMAANNTDGVIGGFEGVWSLSITYQREADAIDGMTIAGASDSGNGTLTKTGIVYGSTVTTPTTGSPASHHFSHWTTSDGKTSTAGTAEADPHTIVVTAPGAVTAHWAPNARKVTLDSNDATGAQATPRVMYTYGVYDEVVKPYPVNTAETGWDETAGKLLAPTRPGYEFAGYWNTQWNEGTGAECYLKADPADKRYLASTTQTWDITNSTQVLYAHWKYKVYLSTNAWNSNGEQLTGSGAGSIDESSVPAGTLKSDAQGTYIETIDGAPITLPKVTGRTGYYDSDKGTDGKTDVNARAWGVKAGSYGWSTGIVPLDANGATSSDPTKLTLSTSNIAATRAYDDAKYFASQDATSVAFPVPTEASGKSITLYLNWENRAKVYDVALTSAYDSFTVSNTPSPKVKAVYDAPILMERDGAPTPIVYADFLQSAAENGIVAPEKIVGSGTERHHEYIFKGFRTEENELDGTDGTEYVGAKVTGTGAAISAVASAVATPWRIDSANPVLYAAWGRVKSTLTLDLNDGTIAGLSGTVLTVMKDGTEFTFTAGEATPALPGAYATAPERAGYIFRGYYTEATGDGAAYAHYAEDGTNVAYYVANNATNPTAAVPADLDWDFYTNVTLYAHWEYKIDFRLDHATDCAQSNPAGSHTAMTLMNAPVTAGATDAYGNRYPVGGAEVTATESNLIVTALAGVPVMVPVAQNRNGYNDTFTWQVRQNDSVSGAARATVTGDKTNRYFTPGTPFAGIAPNANTHTITAYVDWKDQEKTYWVEIVPDQTDTGTLGAKIAGSTPRYIKVKFNEQFPVDEEGNVLTTAPRDTDTNRNLVFQGIYAAAASIGDVSGTRYVSVSDGATVPAAAFVPKTRTDGYRIEDALVGTGNAAAPTATTHPIPVYARWAYPSCLVSFDMNTGNIDGADAVTNAFELKTNDSLPSLSALSGDAAALAQKPIKRVDGGTSGTSDYVFDGYWSAPSGGKQYYTKDLAAAPGITWDFAGATTLYAHWTYTVRLNLNGNVPASLQNSYVDGMTVAKANGSDDEPTPAPVAGDSPVRAYAITVVWGADATVPATTANVKRVRYEKPYSETAPKTVQNDYAFAGWLAAANATDTLFASGANVALGGTNKSALTPSAGTVNLYAKWTCEPYRVALDHKGGASLADDAFAQTEDGAFVTGTSELIGVVFDAPVHELGDVLAAPHRLGYTFMGYYETPQASDPNHESACYLEPTEGGMAATNTLWPSHRGTGTAPTLYAHYRQNSYIITFEIASPDERADGGPSNPVEPARIGSVGNVTYQMVLDTYSSDNLVLACEGYKFGGWYTETDGKGRMMFNDQGAGQGTYSEEHNVTLHAKWTPRTLSVVWDFNLPKAANMTMAAKKSTETYNQPRSALAPAVPTVTGYTFTGWFRDKTNSVREWETGKAFRPSDTDLSADEITYYAHWSAVDYTVTLLPGEHGTYENKAYLDAVRSDGDGGYIYVHRYTVENGNWSLNEGEPEALPGWDFLGWDQVARNDDDTDWTIVKESVDYVNAESFGDGRALTFRAVWTATKATVRLNLGECEGVKCDPAALGDFPATFKYGIGSPRTLPENLTWPGYTFLGWQLTKQDDVAIPKKDLLDPDTNMPVEATDGETPSNLEYTACWVKDAYTIEFVKSAKDATFVAEAVKTGTDANGNEVALGRDTTFAFPTPAFRGGFTGGTVAGDVLKESSSYIFSHYTTAAGGSFLPGQTTTVGDLLTTYPTLRDTKGDVPHNGSVIRLYAVANASVYNVDVPLVASITFDPDHADTSVKTADVSLFIRRANQTAPIEVAGLICDPIAASGTSVPGTSATFDNDPSVLDGTYLTLAARKGTASVAADPIEINLGQVARNAGKGVTLNGATATDGTFKPLSDFGFAFGGTTEADRTLNLSFGLRFDDGVDASKLRYLNDKAFKDTGKTVPIARVYYTLALARPQTS